MGDTLSVIVEADEIVVPETDEAKGLFGLSKNREAGAEEPKRKRIAVKEIPVEKLEENLRRFCGTLSGMLKDVKAVGDFKLTEVTVQVEISAEGGIEMIGTGKVGGKGAITLTFTE